MADNTTAMEAFLAVGGVLQTRLRERSMGEVHDLPTYPLATPGMSLCPEEVVSILEQLEQTGTVRRCYEAVHPYDSSEYSIAWGIARERQAPCSLL